MKAISGLLHAERGQLTKGSIEFGGERLDHLAPHDVVVRGITQVFEGRRVFENLTVEENLVVGGRVQASIQRVRQGIDLVFEYFPLLKERRRQHAGYLSGGEQQMLAIGRALVSEPKVILLDEPSLGLAPLIVESIFAIIRRLKEERGQTVFLVEQNPRWPWIWPTTAMSWRTGKSCWRDPRPACARTRRSRSSIWA